MNCPNLNWIITSLFLLFSFVEHTWTHFSTTPPPFNWVFITDISSDFTFFLTLHFFWHYILTFVTDWHFLTNFSDITLFWLFTFFLTFSIDSVRDNAHRVTGTSQVSDQCGHRSGPGLQLQGEGTYVADQHAIASVPNGYWSLVSLHYCPQPASA